MIETIVGAIAPGIIVGIVLALWEKRQKKRDARNSDIAANRQEMRLRLMDLQIATAQLAHATAMAIKRGAPNGEMESALEAYDSAMSKFRSFERKHLTFEHD